MRTVQPSGSRATSAGFAAITTRGELFSSPDDADPRAFYSGDQRLRMALKPCVLSSFLALTVERASL